MLDNEISTDLINIFESRKITYQLVPPENYRRNTAERAIKTWKNHFIAGLSSVDPTFPMTEWDCLVQQGELTLNLLRNARVKPNLSAWAYLFGQFNYNATPLAPTGTKLIVHLKTHKRGSWEPHGVIAYYTGPAMHHYRCYTVFVPKKRTEQITDTVTFLPSHIPIPKLDPETKIQQALQDILQLLKQPNNNLPALPISDTSTQEIQTVSGIFTQPYTQQSSTKKMLDPHLVEKILNTTSQKIMQIPSYTIPNNRGCNK